MDNQWNYEEGSPTDITALAENLNIPLPIARILLKRKIQNLEQAKLFFRPNIQNLNDPFLMKDMDIAVDRIITAKKNQENVVIYGDYDVDGTTSIALLTLFFKEIGLPTKYYIPKRLKEGYGLSKEAIDEIKSWGAHLIITTDCGITASDQVAHANQLGIDVIISDHHQPGNVLPNALAVLNPNQPGCEYPFKELAGIGVAFKLVQAIAQRLGLDHDTYCKYLDLAGIGSSADIVPLIDENRILVHEGLKRINETPRIGVQALLLQAGLFKKEIGTGQIVFSIAPRINAAGRMGEANRAVDLLVTESENLANNIATILEAENKSRRLVDEKIFKEACEILEEKTVDAKFIVLSQAGWHPGVIGIVASRLVEKFYRPTVLIATENGVGKGSVRSIPGFNVYEALKSCEQLMLGFGGHKYAAGIKIESDKIPQLCQQLNEYADKNMDENLLIPKIRIDTELNLDEMTPRFLKILKLFAPFGPQNMRPVFMSQNLEVVGSPNIVGKNHLRMKVRQNGVVVDSIGFHMGDLMYRVEPSKKNLDMVYCIEENEFLGRTNLQLKIKDLR